MSEANSASQHLWGEAPNPTHRNPTQIYDHGQNTRSDPQVQGTKPAGKKRRHRGHRRRRHRRPSFAGPLPREDDQGGGEEQPAPGASPGPPVEGGATMPTSPDESKRSPLYKLGQLGGNLSHTSLDSQELLDHRNQPTIRTRRESRLGQSLRPELQRPELPAQSPSATRETPQYASHFTKPVWSPSRSGDEESDNADDRTPLIKPNSVNRSSFVRYGTDGHLPQSPPGRSPPSPGYNIDRESRTKRDYDVNNPPSMPGTPKTGPEMGYDDALIAGLGTGRSRSPSRSPRDAVIDVDENVRDPDAGLSQRPPSPPELTRRRTVTLPVEEDVCFPTGGLSDLAEEEFPPQVPVEGGPGERRRRRRREWPDLSVLEDWSGEEKESRGEAGRAKKISEPVLIGGRLRTRNSTWKHDEEEAPFRFTYFNEEFPSTIHSQTISELVQPGQTFRDLFIPEPPELEPDSSEDEEDEADLSSRANSNVHGSRDYGKQNNGHVGGYPGHVSPGVFHQKPNEKRYGPRPTFWLDVLCPTDTEMRVIAKAFGIHALTVEDIMMQEAREKVELFRHYYFINYCTFEQDPNSPNFLQPVNMYVIVFREGLLSFHFSMVPHPANVRRRIRQLRDYLILSADWISYAIIDDITDVFGPLIHSIEEEVDQIDDTVLRLHSDPKYLAPKFPQEKVAGGHDEFSALDAAPSGSDMLRRVGECRKKVMGIYRLLGNKADVIKGFAKRCNEHWEVAPKSEIGLYLGDIQDHILTMTSNLTHYETLLSRAHSNYLAQINIRMNERQEQTADVLGKLTVLGTIVLPMNIICGMWGMNVKVPGQEVDNLHWFFSITAGLLGFGIICFYVAKRVYGIV